VDPILDSRQQGRRGKVKRSEFGIALLLFMGLVAFESVSAQKEETSRVGWISDEACGRLHTKPGGAECVEKCWRGGASVGHPEWKPQRAVFVADPDEGIWIVENPEAVKNFPAAHVRLTGKFDSAKKAIYVDAIAEAAK
jgi:hypothetical protein